MNPPRLALTLVLANLSGAISMLAGEEPPKPDAPVGYLNLKASTDGGNQFWSDELLFHDWRIQRNVISGHYRLLDGRDVRHAWGNFEHCRLKLAEIKREEDLPPMTGKAVIALHGLGRTRKSLASLCNHLREEGGYTVLNVSYASTRCDIAAHAESLAKIVASLDGIDEINFVAHSLGNLVIRHYLADETDAAAGRYPDARIRRIVMLAPPNNGAQLAVTFKHAPLLAMIWGKSGDQLAEGWNDLAKRLATPQCPFGIIAGGKGREAGGNPLLVGDDDFVVTVDETRLAGATDFLVVDAYHTFIMHDRQVKQYTLSFLQHGYFISEAERQPITADSHTTTPSP